MGALLFTIAWVAMVLLGVFVLLIGIASVRNGDGDAVRNGLLLHIVYLLLLLLLKMYSPTGWWEESVAEVKTFFSQHAEFLVAIYMVGALCALYVTVKIFAAFILTDDEKLKNFNRRFDAAWFLVSFLFLIVPSIVQVVVSIVKVFPETKKDTEKCVISSSTIRWSVLSLASHCSQRWCSAMLRSWHRSGSQKSK